jgi:hypothetical protein
MGAAVHDAGELGLLISAEVGGAGQQPAVIWRVAGTTGPGGGAAVIARNGRT